MQSESKPRDVCCSPMALACTLPALGHFPALRTYECTACHFARPVSLDGPADLWSYQRSS
jgi:hypothetical protein